jgi:putative membrane-bound dehydrogenase-like protein
MPYRLLSFVLLVLFVAFPSSRAAAAEDPLGVRVPDGFKVTLFADDDLAHDIFALTVDSLGRVVVSGPGYVRILLDRDGDGRADAYQQYADGPKTGSQGMCFDGRDLICTGDAGLLRYRDANGDDRADGPPETLLRIKAGGEHHAHAVERGPDGWWYVMAGNMSGVTQKDVTLPTSPVLRPRAGTLLRLKPDFSGCEVVAHGFRNAYDFAFNAQGDVFTYDSDGEREVSLPWYRPTRVFHVLPGSDAGWVSETWKHPDYFPDMPPVLASLGRGSPTGVLCYRHDQFPAEYRGALFVADWTFGRIVALPLTRDGETWKTTPKDFMTGSGTFGFAPTDMEVAPDGSMYVSVGGRGTRGGVYRVTYTAGGKRQLPGDTPKAAAPTPAEQLAACLSAPQPLASWSRATWLPLAKKIGSDALQAAALDEKRATIQRVRAIEILAELFDSLAFSAKEEFGKAKAAEVRARAAWCIGRKASVPPSVPRLLPFLEDEEPLVARCAWEALIGTQVDTGVPALSQQLSSSHWFVAQTASRIIAHRPLAAANGGALRPKSSAGWSWSVLAEMTRLKPSYVPGGTDEFVNAIRDRRMSANHKLLEVRLAQLVIGVLPAKDSLPPFHGYSVELTDPRNYDRGGRLATRLSSVFPTGDRNLDIELSRIFAMQRIVPDDRVLDQISDASHPTDDVHYLFVMARGSGRLTSDQRKRVSQALLLLDDKIARLKLNIDTNWEPSIAAMYAELVKREPELPATMVGHDKFGRTEHVVFTKNLPANLLPAAIAAFERGIRQDETFPIATDLVFLLGKSSEAKHVDLVRRLHDDRLAVRGAALIVLAKRAEAADRAKFVAGLDEAEPDVLAACLEALAKLPSAKEAKEQVALLRALRRLSGDEREYALRDKAAVLLRRAWNEDFDFISGKSGYRPQPQAIAKWTDFVRDQFPAEFARQTSGGGSDETAVRAALAQSDWSGGDVDRGAKLFEARSCSRCHSGRTALGPDLAGATRRFSRDDLFTAIIEPSRDVSPRYQATMIQTADGKTYSGLVIYESVDGVTLRDGLNQTIRIDGTQIEARRKQAASFMPSGLLKDLKSQDLADLYVYLQSLAK